MKNKLDKTDLQTALKAIHREISKKGSEPDSAFSVDVMRSIRNLPNKTDLSSTAIQEIIFRYASITTVCALTIFAIGLTQEIVPLSATSEMFLTGSIDEVFFGEITGIIF